MIHIGIMMTDPRSASLVQYVRSQSQLELMFNVSSVTSLQAALIVKGAPDVLLLHLPKQENDELADVFAIPRKMKTVVMVDDASGFKADNYSNVRAKGYYLATPEWSGLNATIEAVRYDGAYISPRLAVKILDDMQRDPLEKYRDLLTRREIEILNLACGGLSYKEIAEKMFITSFTVNQHLKKVYAKMQVRSKGELISKILGSK